MFRSRCILFVLISILSNVFTLNSGIFLRNDCLCPGYNLTIECTIIGGIGGSTAWKGEVFRNSCMVPRLLLRHREFVSGASVVCNNGNIVLRSLQVNTENNSYYYTSQLTITYSMSLIGSTIFCAYDNGTQDIPIGSKTITPNSKSYPPPASIRLMSVNQYQLTIAWNPVTPECSAFHYSIFATNCGTCPSTTIHNTVTCTAYHVSTLCLFAVQSVFCGDISTTANISEPVQVMLRVPGQPFVNVIVPRYSYLTGDAIGFMVEFTDVPSFAISDGVDGSAISYTLAYNNSVSGVSCGSATVPASSCEDGVCQHSFTYEESFCSSPSININITISAANVLGNGPASNPLVFQSNRNTVFNVTFNLSSNSIICTFINQQKSANMKSCQIEYGSREDDCSTFTLVSKNTNNVIVPIDLPSHFFMKGYCFRVKGCNGTHAAFVEGTYYNPGNSNQSDLPMVILVIVIVVSFGGITTLITIIAILVRVHRRIQMRLLSATQTTTAPEPVTISGVYEEPDCQFNLQDNTTL